MIKKWDYEYDEHKISIIHSSLTNGRTTLAVDGQIQDVVLDNPAWKFKMHGQLSSGESVDVKINNIPKLGDMFRDMEEWVPRSIEVAVDGVQLEQKPMGVRTMNRESLEKIATNYDRLGRLSNEEFLAIKSLSKPVEFARVNSDPGLSFGDKKVNVSDRFIQPGDDIAWKNDFTGKKWTITDITDFTKWGHELFSKYCIENEDKCVTNCNIKTEKKMLDALLADPETGLTIDKLTSVIGPDTTLSEYEAIRELRDGGIEITDQILDDLARGVDVQEIAEIAYNGMQQDAQTLDDEEITHEH